MLYDTRILLDRVAPLEQAGQWMQAIELCSTAFARSIVERDVDTLSEAVLRAGFCYRQLGQREVAEEQLQLALAIAELHADKSRAGRALNGLATLYHVHGDLHEAERCYTLARQFACCGDGVLSAYIDQNLGVLAVIRGQTDAALAHYHSALHLYQAQTHDRGIAQVLNNMGMLHIALGDLELAQEYLEESLLHCRKSGEVVTEGFVYINRAEIFLTRSELDQARSSCDEAYEIFSRLGDNSGKLEALKFYGVIYRDQGKLYLAETHLRAAINIAEIHLFPLEEAECFRELSLVLQAQERNKEALQSLNRAHELFSELNASHYQADITQRIGQLERDFLALVQTWGESIEAKDRYTRGHCQRVAEFACRIAERAGIPEREMVWFRMGAFLHDLGKTGVAEEILNKPGKLTESERKAMEHHTVLGDEILGSVDFPWDIRPMVRSHHERWDGRGYPDGLSGSEIPFTARILRIADVFDALTSNRSYRRPLTPEEALVEMQCDEGAFDPELLDLFLELFPEVRSLALSEAIADDM